MIIGGISYNIFDIQRWNKNRDITKGILKDWESNDYQSKTVTFIDFNQKTKVEVKLTKSRDLNQLDVNKLVKLIDKGYFWNKSPIKKDLAA